MKKRNLLYAVIMLMFCGYQIVVGAEKKAPKSAWFWQWGKKKQEAKAEAEAVYNRLVKPIVEAKNIEELQAAVTTHFVKNPEDVEYINAPLPFYFYEHETTTSALPTISPKLKFAEKTNVTVLKLVIVRSQEIKEEIDKAIKLREEDIAKAREAGDSKKVKKLIDQQQSAAGEVVSFYEKQNDIIRNLFGAGALPNIAGRALGLVNLKKYRGTPLDVALRVGNAIAALTLRREGARTTPQTITELENIDDLAFKNAMILEINIDQLKKQLAQFGGMVKRVQGMTKDEIKQKLKIAQDKAQELWDKVKGQVTTEVIQKKAVELLEKTKAQLPTFFGPAKDQEKKDWTQEEYERHEQLRTKVPLAEEEPTKREGVVVAERVEEQTEPEKIEVPVQEETEILSPEEYERFAQTYTKGAFPEQEPIVREETIATEVVAEPETRDVVTESEPKIEEIVITPTEEAVEEVSAASVEPEIAAVQPEEIITERVEEEQAGLPIKSEDFEAWAKEHGLKTLEELETAARDEAPSSEDQPWTEEEYEKHEQLR